jgi:flagellar basal body-associated protein FliL
MKNLKNADSLVWIIIWIFILAIALLGIINVLWFSQNTLSIYKDSINKYIVESNVENITKKLSNDIIDNSNTFFLYKDTINNEFKYLTWSINEEYNTTYSKW